MGPCPGVVAPTAKIKGPRKKVLDPNQEYKKENMKKCRKWGQPCHLDPLCAEQRPLIIYRKLPSLVKNKLTEGL